MHKFQICLTIQGLMLLVLGAGCGGQTPAEDAQTAADTADAGGGKIDTGKVGDGADGGKTDASAGETAGETTDVDADDAVDVSADATADDADASEVQSDCPGAPGCPCQDNGSCDFPVCLPTKDGPQCAKPCVDTCKDGYKCIGVSGPGGDLVNVCVDKWPHLCDPCVNSSQCGAVGLSGTACVDHGAEGNFCGTTCSSDGDCPGGYTCKSGKSVEGNSISQCQPSGGTCACSAAASTDQLSTSCFADAKDDKGQVIGSCKGARSCGPGGLTACNASIQTETCNGQDDNCNGQVDEGTCDDKNACTTDVCDDKAQNCLHSNAAGSCDADGNNCTVNDSCQGGMCVVGSLKNCDDGNPCTTDGCDPKSGCFKSNDDGLPCSDGTLCTVGDSCAGGECKSGTVKVCADSTACATWSCESSSGQCKEVLKLAGTSCSDGTACTSADACTDGNCIGTPVDCDDKNGCTLDTCDAIKGCKHDAANSPCDDKNACTSGDTCQNSKCSGTAIVVADVCGDGNPCTTDTCAPASGCVNTANTQSCSDGNSCTIGDKCDGGACKSGTNTCQCQNNDDCAKEEDGNFCNGTLFCDTSGGVNQCKVNPATVVSCTSGGDGPCVKNTCNSSSGKCEMLSAANGKACDADGSACTINDTCKDGQCTAGALLSCDDKNPCTDDACSPESGCVNIANVATCDADDNACTQNDQCNGKLCVAGPYKNCNDGNDCTADACDQSSGLCAFDPAPKESTACDADGSVCTVGDKCSTGSCVAGTAVVCTDSNACTSDFCDPASGCGHSNLADGTACGTGLWCVAVSCVKKPVCGDGVVDSGEACDDKNLDDGDGCSSKCQWDAAVWPKVGELLITELMGAPKSNANAEWIEVYNPTSKFILMEGLALSDHTCSPSCFFAVISTASGNWQLAPGAYGLIAGQAKIGTVVADASYDITGMEMSNSNPDGLCISTDGQCGASSRIVDGGYQSAASGYSWQLQLSKYATAYSGGKATATSTNWCKGVTPIPGDAQNFGTPKAPPDCP